MKRCATCGKQYEGAERFCREDGTPLLAVQPASATAESAVATRTPAAPSDELPDDAAPQVSAPTATGQRLAADAQTVVGPLPLPDTDPGISPAAQPVAQPVAKPAAQPVATPARAPSSADGMPPPMPVLQMPARPKSTQVPATKAVPAPSASASRPVERPSQPVEAKSPSSAAIADSSAVPTLLTSMPEEGDEVQSAYIGKLIADRYLVSALIGRGGMGAVFACEQVHLRKTMAIKLLHENLISKKQLIARFTREARAISRLSSAHTVMVYDFGRWGELFYLVMELIEGEPLDGLLDREGPLPAERVARIVLQMCDSLAEAHKHGIVHRDLKPENVMLLKQGAHPDFVKILDFGLAKVQGVDDPYTIHSQRDIFGTPYYMSPEQIRAGDIDGRADIYAVGTLMFRMLTGEHVFRQSNTFDILKAHLMEPAPRMASVAPGVAIPPVFERIVAKALEKDPANRFASMDELAKVLAEALRASFRDSGAIPILPNQLTDKEKAAPHPMAAPAARVATARATTAAKPAAPVVVDHVDLDEPLPAKPDARQTRKTWAFFAILLLCAAGVLAYLYLGEAPAPVEQEPNDTAGQANPLGPGDQVKGVIGKRRGERQGDRDCFRLPTANENEDVAIKVVGVPNMDLQLTLTRDGDKPLLVTSHAGRGQGEQLRLVDPRLGATTVCVAEVVAQGQVPGESLSDKYTLQVEKVPRSLHSEHEPNDDPPGNEWTAQVPTSGVLDGPLDRDTFALSGNASERMLKIEVEVPPAQQVTGLRVALLDGAHHTIAAQRVIGGELKTALSFVGSSQQQPDAVVVQRMPLKGVEIPADPLPYTVQYKLLDGGAQTETEPNNTEDSGGSLVLGAWHYGDTGDSAAVDWLRVEAGDVSAQQLRMEVAADVGQFTLLVRDKATRTDLRQLTVTDNTVRELVVGGGTGDGFLIRIAPLDQPGKKRELAKWRLRARLFTGP